MKLVNHSCAHSEISTSPVTLKFSVQYAHKL